MLGVLAVMAGVGGGVLYVPLVSGFFPFHIDFVRGVITSYSIHYTKLYEWQKPADSF